jgi:hypothetical protein
MDYLTLTLLGSVTILQLIFAVLVLFTGKWLYRSTGSVSGYWVGAWLLLEIVSGFLSPVMNQHFMDIVIQRIDDGFANLGQLITTLSYTQIFFRSLAILSLGVLVCAETVRLVQRQPMTEEEIPQWMQWIIRLYPYRHILGILAMGLMVCGGFVRYAVTLILFW